MFPAPTGFLKSQDTAIKRMEEPMINHGLINNGGRSNQQTEIAAAAVPVWRAKHLGSNYPPTHLRAETSVR